MFLLNDFELLVEPAELLGHAVHVRRKRPQLVAIDDVDPPAEVAGRDLVELRFDLLDRPEHRPRNGISERQRQHDAAQCKADHDPLRVGVGARARLDAGHHVRFGLVHQLIGEPLELIGERGRLPQLSLPRLGSATAPNELDHVGHDFDELIVIAAELIDKLRFVLGHEFQPVDVVAELVELAQRAVEGALVRGNQRRRHAVKLARGVVLDLAIGLDLALQLDQLLGALVHPAQLTQAVRAENHQQRDNRKKCCKQLCLYAGGSPRDHPDERIQNSNHSYFSRLTRSRRNSSGSKRTPRYCTRRMPR